MYFYQKTKRVGDTTTNLILLAALGVGGYLIFKNFLGGIETGTSSNNAAIDQNTQSTVANDQAAAAAQGIKQTLSDSTLNTMANSIFYAVGNGDDPSGIVSTVSQVNNYADWLRLVQLYGTRKLNTGSWYSPCALTGLLCDSVDLGTTLKQGLPPQYLSNLDSYFSDQGIPVIL